MISPARLERSRPTEVSTPEPVARYLRRALGSRSNPITRAELRQEGELRTDSGSARWLPFTASEVVRPLDVAFEWDARVRFAPFIRVRVQDAYRNGKGAGRVSLLSAITIAKERGSAELDCGSLFRFLAEAPWYPSVLMPSGRLRWNPIDGSRASASLTDQGVTVTLEFRFDAAGYIAAIHTDARPRKAGSGYEIAAWEGHFADYAERDGLRVPLRGEVGWYADGTWMPVWRGRIVEARYQFLP